MSKVHIIVERGFAGIITRLIDYRWIRYPATLRLRRVLTMSGRINVT